ARMPSFFEGDDIVALQDSEIPPKVGDDNLKYKELAAPDSRSLLDRTPVEVPGLLKRMIQLFTQFTNIVVNDTGDDSVKEGVVAERDSEHKKLRVRYSSAATIREIGAAMAFALPRDLRDSGERFATEFAKFVGGEESEPPAADASAPVAKGPP